MPDGFHQGDLTALTLPILSTDNRLVGRGDNVYRTPMGGMAWQPSIQGTVIRPQAADFPTWVNQDSATITDDDFGMVLNSGVAKTGVSVQQRLRSLPVGASWTVELGVQRLFPFKSFFDAGIILRESGTGKLESAGYGNPGGGFQQVKWTSPSASSAVRFNQSSTGAENSQMVYFRAILAASNITWYASLNGAHFFQFGPAFAVNNFFTTAPNQWGFFINNNNNSTPNINMDCRAFHWKEI